MKTVTIITYENGSRYAFLSREEADLAMEEWGGNFTIDTVELTTFDELFADRVWKGWKSEPRRDTGYTAAANSTKKGKAIPKGARIR